MQTPRSVQDHLSNEPRLSFRDGRPGRWLWLSLATLLGFVATTEAQLSVVNGDFSDLTGLTSEGGGWYSGVPTNWISTGAATYSQQNGVCNVSQLGYFDQNVGTTTNTGEVNLNFDLLQPWNTGTSLAAFIFDGSYNTLASGVYSNVGSHRLTATGVPSGTTIIIEFQSAVSTPGLDNVTVAGGPFPPTITSQPASNSALPLDTALTLTVAATGAPTLSYQWRSNSVALAGATSASLTVTNPGNYTVVVTAGNSLSVTSAVAQVYRSNLLPLLNGDFTSDHVASGWGPLWSRLGPPSATSGWDGSTADGALNFDRLGMWSAFTSAYLPSYDLKRTLLGPSVVVVNFVAGYADQGGATVYPTLNVGGSNLTQTITIGSNAAPYMAAFTNGALTGNATLIMGGSQNFITKVSSVAFFKPSDAPSIVEQPAAKVAKIAGTVRTLSVSALGLPPLSYQWRSNGVALAGATSVSLTVSQPGDYTVVVTGGNSQSVTSTVAQVIGSVVNGSFSDLSGMFVQGGGWYAGLPAGWVGVGNYYAVNGTAGATPPLANMNVLTNLSQTVGTLTNTSDVVLTFDFSHPPAWGGPSPEISALILTNSVVMASNRFDYNSYGTKTVVATNAPAGASLSVKFVNETPGQSPALDNVSTVVINASLPPGISQQPAAWNAMIPGTVRTLSVTASGVLPVSYQWRSNNVAIGGATAASLTVSKPGSYDVVITGGNSLSVTSSVAQVIGSVVNGNFSDLSGLTSLANGWYAGVPAGWIGPAVDYTVNGSLGTNPPTANPSVFGVLRQIVGTLTNTSDVVLQFDNNTAFTNGTPWTLGVAILDESLNTIASGSFSPGLGQTLVATNVPAGTTVSIQFTAVAGFPGLDNVGAVSYITGSPTAPQIIEQPVDFTLLAPGDNLNLSVYAIGLPPLSYQWRTNAVALGGQTNASLTVSSVTPDNGGDFTVVVTGPGGSVTSAVAQVVVVSTPPVTIISDPMNATAGTLLNGTTPASRGGIGSWAWGAGTNLVMDGTNLTEAAASDSAFIPFTPDAGNIYTLSCQMDILSGNWIALGFSQNSHPENYSGFWTSTNVLQAWMCQVGTGDYFLFTGPELTAAVGTPYIGPGFNSVHTNAIVLNTVGANWTLQYFVDGAAVGGPAAYSPTPGVNPVINYVGIGNSDTNFNPAGQSATFKNFKLKAALPRIIPALGIQKSGSNATLSWSTATGGWALESSPSLSSPSWTPVPGVANNSVTVSIGTGNQFFRLRSTY